MIIFCLLYYCRLDNLITPSVCQDVRKANISVTPYSVFPYTMQCMNQSGELVNSTGDMENSWEISEPGLYYISLTEIGADPCTLIATVTAIVTEDCSKVETTPATATTTGEGGEESKREKATEEEEE